MNLQDLGIDEVFIRFIKYRISSKRFRNSYIAEVMNTSPQYLCSVLNRYTVKSNDRQRGISLRLANKLLLATESNWQQFHSYLGKEYEIL